MTKLLGQTVVVETDVIGAGGAAAVAALQSGNILMMENLRFYPEEEANDQRFAKSLPHLGIFMLVMRFLVRIGRTRRLMPCHG